MGIKIANNWDIIGNLYMLLNQVTPSPLIGEGWDDGESAVKSIVPSPQSSPASGEETTTRVKA